MRASIVGLCALGILSACVGGGSSSGTDVTVTASESDSAASDVSSSSDETTTDASTTNGPPTSGDDSDGTGGVPAELTCADGYRCYEHPETGVVWVMKIDGNINGPTCQDVCEAALPDNCEYHACEEGHTFEYPDANSFAPIAKNLGFTCREGGCWDSVAPGEGLMLVSIDTDEEGSKACYFPSQSQLSCSTHPGNANCFGERYASICPCVPRALDDACSWECPPHNTTRATWKTEGTSCLARINYWRKRACEEGWPECPPAGLPPMVECTACHECSNSEAQHDSENGAHASFKRCGESAQGEGGGQTCADVIDAFVSERAPDENGIVRCTGHCGPIVAPGCRSFSWGKAMDSNYHTLNWGGCNASTCEEYCDQNAGDCYTHESSPSLSCQDPDEGKEDGPIVQACL
ncbi:MAG: hypothetical protein H6713_14410 [Myxococcales bacterium]|nr:hypothetical protein [Myxococcales bacterium]